MSIHKATPLADNPPEKAVAKLVPTGRMEAFSDGVFAIVITLLVLELKVPAGGGDLWGELAHEWPAYLGYFVSFAFIGASWIAHTNMTRYIKASDPALLRLNLLLLLLVSLLPFTTSLMAQNLNNAGGRPAVVLFGLNLTLSAVVTSLVLRYVSNRPDLASEDVAETGLRAFERERRVAVGSLVLATVLAIFFPVAAVSIFMLISALLLLEPVIRAQRATPGAQGAAEQTSESARRDSSPPGRTGEPD
jgi:uncharacterized membrane protein